MTATLTKTITENRNRNETRRDYLANRWSATSTETLITTQAGGWVASFKTAMIYAPAASVGAIWLMFALIMASLMLFAYYFEDDSRDLSFS